MSNLRPKSLSELIEANEGAVQRLAKEASGRLALTDHLRSGMDPELALHLASSNLRDDGTLVLLVSGPEWAARLRFESDRLLALCREQYPAAARVRIRVAHPG